VSSILKGAYLIIFGKEFLRQKVNAWFLETSCKYNCVGLVKLFFAFTNFVNFRTALSRYIEGVPRQPTRFLPFPAGGCDDDAFMRESSSRSADIMASASSNMLKKGIVDDLKQM
jgi:hypothetical protein